MRQSQKVVYTKKKSTKPKTFIQKPVPSKAPVKKDDGEDEALIDDWEKMALDDDAPVADDWEAALDEGDEEEVGKRKKKTKKLGKTKILLLKMNKKRKPRKRLLERPKKNQQEKPRKKQQEKHKKKKKI